MTIWNYFLIIFAPTKFSIIGHAYAGSNFLLKTKIGPRELKSIIFYASRISFFVFICLCFYFAVLRKDEMKNKAIFYSFIISMCLVIDIVPNGSYLSICDRYLSLPLAMLLIWFAQLDYSIIESFFLSQKNTKKFSNMILVVLFSVFFIKIASFTQDHINVWKTDKSLWSYRYKYEPNDTYIKDQYSLYE